MKALYPIKHQYAEAILEGTKTYEYRKSVCTKPIDAIIIYESRGIGMVVGEVEVKGIIEDTPKGLWEKTKDKGGISEEDYATYFKGKSVAYAYEIGKVTTYDEPHPLSDYCLSRVPQSYVYIH